MTPCQTLQTKPVLKMSVSNFGVFSFDFLFVDIIWFQNDFEASVIDSPQFVQIFWHQDLIITSLHCMTYIYHNLRAENLVFHQKLSFDWYLSLFSLRLFSKIYYPLWGEITHWSLLVAEGLKEVQCSFYVLKNRNEFLQFCHAQFV